MAAAMFVLALQKTRQMQSDDDDDRNACEPKDYVADHVPYSLYEMF